MAISGSAWSYIVEDVGSFPLAWRVSGVGKPLLFLHGFGTTSASWLRCADAIRGEYCKILLDLPGHSRSSGPVPATGAVDSCIATISAFLSQINLQQCVVAAHSFGGFLLLRALLSTRLRPAGLILAGVPAFPQRPPKVVNFFASRLGSSLALSALPPEVIAWIGEREVFFTANKIPAELVKEYADSLRAPATVTSLQRIAAALGHEATNASAIDLESLSVPTLILWGSHDRLVSIESGRKLHQTLPHSELYIFPDVGHAPQEEAPVETAALIQAFLERVYQG